MGEEAYYRRLMPMIEQLGPDHWEFLGVLNAARDACLLCGL